MSKEDERLQDAMEMIRAKLELFGLDRPIGTITLHELHELAAMAIKDVSFLHEPPFIAPAGEPVPVNIPWYGTAPGDLIDGQLPFKVVTVQLLFVGRAREADILAIIPAALRNIGSCEYLGMSVIDAPRSIDCVEAKRLFEHMTS